MGQSLLVSAGIAAVGAVLAVIFLPGTAPQTRAKRATAAGSDVVIKA
jgi:hypothetical protein